MHCTLHRNLSIENYASISHPTIISHLKLPTMIFFLAFLVSFMSFANAKCYWPDGGVPDDYLPCPNSTVCCKSGEACLSNGICYGAVLNIAHRGVCADSSWPKDECPHICYEGIDFFLPGANPARNNC